MGPDNFFGDGCDFSDFSKTIPLSFTATLHKAKIIVNEEGTTAAGTTSTLKPKSFRRKLSNLQSFICDHLFVFIIRDNLSRQNLFTGVYRDPSQK